MNAIIKVMDQKIEKDYTNCSLDEMIRDKFQARENAESSGISPFFRKLNAVQSKRRFNGHYQQKQSFNDYTNYLNHMAKKRVQQARRNLDLRRRLNYLRSVKRKVDLRFKLIANMIATFKTRPRNFHQQQRPVLYQYQPQYHNSGGEGMLVVKPHISTNSLRLVEELVGKLPTWLLPINNDLHGRAPAEFHQHIQRAPIHSQQQSMFSIGYDQSHMPPLEYAPSNMPLREHTPASMPNLQFAPPTVKAGINTSSKTQVVQERDDGFSDDNNLEKISIQVPNDAEPSRKLTLNERFTM